MNEKSKLYSLVAKKEQIIQQFCPNIALKNTFADHHLY